MAVGDVTRGEAIEVPFQHTHSDTFRLVTQSYAGPPNARGGSLRIIGSGTTNDTRGRILLEAGGKAVQIYATYSTGDSDTELHFRTSSAGAEAKMVINSAETVRFNNGNGQVEIRGVLGALELSRLTDTERDNIATPANGMVIYNTTDSVVQAREGGAWVDL